MNLYFYARVSPHDRAVHRADRLQAQFERCHKFRCELGISQTHVRYYKDEGELHPIHLLPGLQKLLAELAQEDHKTFVISDLPGRLGESCTKNSIIAQIYYTGGRFIWPGYKRKRHYDGTIEAMLEQIKGGA